MRAIRVMTSSIPVLVRISSFLTLSLLEILSIALSIALWHTLSLFALSIVIVTVSMPFAAVENFSL